jgi:hypothetical protein
MPELEARERELLAAHSQEWGAPVRAITDKYEFRRGFIERVTLSARTFLNRRDELFRLTPLREVHFTDFWTDLATLAATPELARLTGIDFTGRPVQWYLRRLLSSPHLTRLRSLKLSRCNLHDTSLPQLAEWPGLRRLTALDLSHNRLTIEGVRRLVQSPHWHSIPELNLADAPQIAAGMARRAGQPAALDRGEPPPGPR